MSGDHNLLKGQNGEEVKMKVNQNVKVLVRPQLSPDQRTLRKIPGT